MLVEELNLRTNRLMPLFEQLCEISSEMQSLCEQINESEESIAACGRTVEELQAELHYLMRVNFEESGNVKPAN